MKETIDMSGMGGGYEHTCQQMLEHGAEFLKDKPDFDFTEYTTYKNVYGICKANGGDSVALDKAVTEGMDCTGAMHQCVINHLSFIHKSGRGAWIERVRKTQPERIFNYDGTAKSCPVTDISREMEGE